jgi:ATP synthase F1 gamma subunit
MSNTQQIKAALDDSEQLKLVTESLSEIAAMRFKSTRSQIQHNKFFFQEISKVYHTLKFLDTKRRDTKKTPVPTDNRTICVLITSNYHFYGGIDYKLSNSFHQNLSKYPTTEKIIVGSSGKDYITSLDPKGRYEFFVMKKDMPEPSELAQLVGRIKGYGKVLVFHTKFSTILDQKIEVSDLNQSQAQTEATKMEEIAYLLEPELGKMLSFFESQLFGSLLESIFLQAQLSRTAARMVGMDSAELNADKLIAKQKRELNVAKKNLQNIRILEIYPAIRNLIKL